MPSFYKQVIRKRNFGQGFFLILRQDFEADEHMKLACNESDHWSINDSTVYSDCQLSRASGRYLSRPLLTDPFDLGCLRLLEPSSTSSRSCQFKMPTLVTVVFEYCNCVHKIKHPSWDSFMISYLLALISCVCSHLFISHFQIFVCGSVCKK